MKLYYYEHCPYCIRVLMFVLFKKIDLEYVILPNDDEQTPISMIDKKMLPILEKDDGTYLPESLDIIAYLDQLDTPILGKDQSLNTEITAITDQMSTSYPHLVIPRMPQPIFEEFKSQSARDYFTKKKEKMVGPFDKCLTNTPEFIKDISPFLEALSEKLPQEQSKITYLDIHLYPKLYLLQLVEKLELPIKIKKYLDHRNQQLNDANKRLILNH